MDGMSPDLRRKFVLLAIVAFAATATAQSCGSVTSAPDGGTAGAAGSQSGGKGGGAGAAGTSAGGTSAGGTSAGGTGAGGAAGRLDGGTDGPLACSLDQNNCPTGFTCACGGPGPGVCTCHRNCSDANLCPAAEPMCGCPGAPAGTVRFCVNACFCTCN